MEAPAEQSRRGLFLCRGFTFSLSLCRQAISYEPVQPIKLGFRLGKLGFRLGDFVIEHPLDFGMFTPSIAIMDFTHVLAEFRHGLRQACDIDILCAVHGEAIAASEVTTP
jgi:hypothetical protein